jgi:long-chain fatty acid transport protein
MKKIRTENKMVCGWVRAMVPRFGAGRFAVVLIGLGVGLFFARNAAAVAVRLPNQDPEAIARGNAFAATADDPAAIYYNPAGITQLEGENLSTGLYLISAGDKFESSTTGGTASTHSELQPVPQMYFTDSPRDSRFSYGVGVYVPYGLSLDWGPTPPFRDEAIKGNLLYTTINPVAAWRINDQLSIGFGPTINYSKVGFTQGIGLAPDTFRFSGDDADYSFTGGVLWKPFEMLAFGVNYR